MAELKFTQLIFKLMVMDELITKERLAPFSLEVVEKKVGYSLYDGANWKMPEDGFFGMMPEAKEWFEAFPIDSDMVADIESLHWEAGAQIMQDIAPNWDGEDELFDVTPETAADCALLPKLKTIKAVYDKEKEDAVIAAFAEKGVTISHVYG
jgi:hypothetical protein